jgi:DNA-binding NtrC family response regulator
MFERTYLQRLLSEHGGNVANAARVAGKSRTGLWNLITKHHLRPRDFSDSYESKTFSLK